MTGARSRAFALYLLRTILAAGLLALLWQAADGADAVRRLAGANAALLGAAVVVLTLQTGLSALRWRITAAQLGILFDRRTALREYYLSQIVNQALPGGIMGDAGRAVRARAQAGLMASGQAVLFERLAGQIALVAVLCTAFIATLRRPRRPRPAGRPLAAGGLLVLLVCAGAAWVVLRRWLGRSTRLKRLWRAISAKRSRHPGALAPDRAEPGDRALQHPCVLPLCCRRRNQPHRSRRRWSLCH